MKKASHVLLLGVCLSSWGAYGAGFAIIEQNASGLGHAYAGQAAVAQDASTVFFNPAGLSRLDQRELVVAAHLIQTSAQFTDGGSTLGVLGEGGDAGITAPIANAYLSMPINEVVTAGIGLNAPFGLMTEYDTPWAGQTHGLKSDMKSININPSLAWQANDHLSLGLGVSWQRLEAELTQAAAASATPPIASLKGDDSSWGWNIGLLYSPDERNRVGMAYRSRIKQHIEGTQSVNGVVLANIYTDVTLPDTFSMSYFRSVNAQWDVLADATWTGWSAFENFTVLNSATDATVVSIPENWENAWRYSLGASYRQSDKWIWRLGMAYDENPVPDAQHRTVRTPDSDRIWLALGGQYRLDNKSVLDFGYTHIFMNEAAINHTENAVTVLGTYDSHIDILSVQYTHRF